MRAAPQSAECIYGCSAAQAIALNGARLTAFRSNAYLYKLQRQNAALRGIDWCITFAEWLDVWHKSGKLHKRGAGRDDYCMARHGDAGPYSVGNVSIRTIAENSYDAAVKAHAVRRANTARRAADRGQAAPVLG